MHIILLGAPGVGKGTQGDFICQELGIPKISTGDMLRLAITSGGDLAQKIKNNINAGQFVADELIVDMLKERIQQPDCAQGYLLDGFPRTIKQAEALKSANIKIDMIIQLEVPDAMIIKRLSGRRVHLPSGRTYHLIDNPPKVPGLDDVTGEPLTLRDDDVEETISKRLQVYHTKTEPLIAWYEKNNQKIIKIDGSKPIAVVRDEILEKIKPQKSNINL